ncbi:MAG: DUF5615 family PIN-like protein [Acidobacteria bacterium]|nr:DUF5615 family PIN-like protein [Acidobacteriota bacterium]
MKFLVDNQLPTALARFLASRGVDCEHVLDVNLQDADDRVIWAYAGQTGAILISKDGDFLHMANAPNPAARLVWIRLGNCRTRMLLSVVGSAWLGIMAALLSGERVIEVR